MKYCSMYSASLRRSGTRTRFLTLFLGLLILMVVSGISVTGCASKKKANTGYTGTKRGCVIQHRKMGYQRWQADDLCKRMQRR